MTAPIKDLPRIGSAQALTPRQCEILFYTMPGIRGASVFAQPRETIGRMLARTGLADPEKNYAFTNRLPTICLFNGQPLMRRQWRKVRIRQNDSVIFLSKPLGGGSSGSGKQIMGIIALIAIAAFALWAGPALAALIPGIAGLSGGITVGGISLGTIFSAGIAIGGTLLLAALTRPRVGATDQSDKFEQLRSLSVSGNLARPGQTLPSYYGRQKYYPDYCITPWSEFENDDEMYLHVLLNLGLGKYDTKRLYIEDSLLWTKEGGFEASFAGDFELQFRNPGQTITLFPTNVVSSDQVSGQQLQTAFTGPFAISAPGTNAKHVVFDVAFPAGLFDTDEETGNIIDRSAQFIGEVQPINNIGAPTGPTVEVLNETLTRATKQPIRRSFRCLLPSEGRYRARLRVTAAGVKTGTQGGNTLRATVVVWAGLRAELTDAPKSFAGISTLAMRIRASKHLTERSAVYMGVETARILPVWNGTAWVEQETRNPIWAAYDIATNTDYGARRPASKIDFNEVYSQALAADARGDKFDFGFTDAVSVVDALDDALMPSRCRHRWAGDTLTIVRDEWVPSHTRMLLSDREIVRGSLEYDVQFQDENDADAVIVEYLDETVWLPAEVQYPPNDASFTAERPARVRAPGIVQRAKALDFASFWWRCHHYRRQFVNLKTEHDGRLLHVGSAVKIQSDLPQTWGQSGEMVSLTGAGNNVITTDRDVDFFAANAFVELRTRRGRVFGPVQAVQHVSGDKRRIRMVAADLTAVEAVQGSVLTAVEREDDEDPVTWVYGKAGSFSREGIVLTGRPQGDIVELGIVLDNAIVHDPHGIVPPPLPPPPLKDPKKPVILFLTAHYRLGAMEPVLDVGWFPAPGAETYQAQISYDEGDTWLGLYTGIDPNFSRVVERALVVQIRVRGIGRQRGDWSDVVEVVPPKRELPKGIVDPINLGDAIHDLVTREMRDSTKFIDQKLDIVKRLLLDIRAGEFTSLKQVRDNLQVASTDLSAGIEEVKTVGANDRQAFASFSTEVSATIGSHTASIQQQSLAIADVNGRLTTMWAVRMVNGKYIGGFSLFGDPNTIGAVFAVDIFKIINPAKPGEDPVDIFQVGTVNGQPDKIFMNADLFVDGFIKARMFASDFVITDILKARVIEAKHIVLGGVSLDEIALGSISLENVADWAAFRATTTEKELVNQLFNVRIGQGTPPGTKGNVKVSGECRSVRIRGVMDAFMKLYVDGKLRKTWEWGFEGKIPGMFGCTIDNLSEGDHRFRLTVVTAPSGATADFGAGSLSLQQLRR